MEKRGAIRRIVPPAWVGVIGGGQLGRMFTQTAQRMGYRVIVLDPDPHAVAAVLADDRITAPYSDAGALRELARRAAVITIEREDLDVAALEAAVAAGAAIYPGPETLRVIQDKLVQKSLLHEAGIPVPLFRAIESGEDLARALSDFGGRMVLKARRGGYDGRGVAMVSADEDLAACMESFGGAPLMAEEYVPYQAELSMLIARSDSEMVLYPVSANQHEGGVLRESVIPAPVSDDVVEAVRAISVDAMRLLDDYGVFCIEFFLAHDGRVLVNEIAPRPHNSGHYTIEACAASQFEQQLRVITGLPLGSSELRGACALFNILGSDRIAGEYAISAMDELAEIPECHVHLYGKPHTSPRRKLGHITVLHGGDASRAQRVRARVATMIGAKENQHNGGLYEHRAQ